jgi:hypothetical protein
MSTKSTIFLTNEDEHCYDDCSEQHHEDGKFLGNTIYMEINKSNGEVVWENEESFTVKFNNPKSEIYNNIRKTYAK